MSDLQVLLKEAATPGEQRTLDIDRAIRRGDQLRWRRQATRVGSVAVAVLVVPLLLLQLPSMGGHNVEFVPDERPVFSTPTPSPTPTPTPTPTPSREPEDRVVGVVIPAPVVSADADARSPRLAPAPTADGRKDTATGAAAARKPRSRSGALPAAVKTRPAKADEVQSPPEEEESDSHSGPPHRDSCALYGSQLEMGETDTCTFTATHTGGYEAHGMVFPPVYDEDVATPPDYWTLEIRRGDEVTRYDVKNAPAACLADVISPGDVVTATVYRSDPTKDSGQTGYVDFYVGKGYGSGCGEN